MKIGTKEILLILLLLGIPVGAYMWVFKPANETMEKQQDELDKKKKKLEDLKQALRGIEDLDAEVEKLSEAITFFENKLPAQHEIHKILEQVTKVAENHKLETRLFKTLKSKPFAHYNEQPIEMEVYGDFDAYYQFLLDVEKLPRITKIKDMELLKDKDKEGVTNANFILSIYFDNNTTAKG